GVPELGAELALLTVPAEAAQAVADVLSAAGVRGILNFAPVLLRLPPRVRLVTVDLAIQLEQLAFLIQVGEAESRDEAGEGGPGLSPRRGAAIGKLDYPVV